MTTFTTTTNFHVLVELTHALVGYITNRPP